MAVLYLLAAAVVSAGCGGGVGSIASPPAGNAALSDSFLFQLGESAQRTGDTDAALELYRRLLAEFPASALADDALVGVGDLELSAGNFEQARAAYASAFQDHPGSDRATDARLAWARSFDSEFEALDAATPGFVDPGSTGEFLVNLQAQEAWGALVSDETLELSRRASAALGLGDAFSRGRQFEQARSAFAEAARLSTDPAVKSQARIHAGLALLQLGQPDLADEAFRSAGATAAASQSSQPGTGARAQFGSISGPPIGSVALDELLIVVHRVVENENVAEQLRNAADVGVALNRAFARRDFAGSVPLLDELARRQLAEPMGDLILFQLAESRREAGEPDGALRDFATLTRTFAGSTFAQRAHGRIGELLFERFGLEAAADTRVEGRLVDNLVASLRQAVGSSPQPEREARTRALELLGRLEGEGIPQPLVIAQPRGLPAGVVGAEYREQLAAFGASGVLQWTAEPASPLPDGLSLSSSGELSGVPRRPGRTFVRLTVRDATGQSDSRSFLLSVLPFRVLTPPRLFDAVAGKPYSFRLQAEGEGPFTFEVALVQRLGEDGRLATLGGSVPGLTLRAEGLLSGTPSQATGSRPYLLSVRVRDRNGRQGAAFFTLFVVETGQAAPAIGPGVPRQAESAGIEEPLEAKRLFSAPRVLSAGFTLTTVPAHPQQLQVTRDGKWAVAISGLLNDVLTRVDLASGEVRQVSLGPRVAGVLPNSLALSPDGRLAAVGLLSGAKATDARLVDLASMRVLRSVPGGLFLDAVAFTPDGRKLLVRSGSGLTSLELEAGTTSTVSLAAIGRGPCLAVFPDSRRVLVAGRSSSNLAAVVDLEAGTTISFALPGFVQFGEVLGDGTTALLQEYAGSRLFMLDLASGTVESLHVGGGAGNLAVSPDGSRAVVPAQNSGEAAVIDLAARRVRRLRPPLPSGISSGALAISPDGRTAVLFDTNPGGDYGLLLDLDTLAGRVIPGFGAVGGSGRHRAVFTPDGRSVLTVRYELTPPGTPGRLLKLEVASAPEGVGLVRQPLAAAVQGSAYSHRFQARGGSPAYRFELAVPAAAVPGLALSAEGLLSGTPAEAALYALEVSVSDSRSTSAEVLAPLLVRERGDNGAPALFLVTREVAGSSPKAAYRQPLAVLGGQPPYAFRVSEGGLPAGLGLSADGVLSGSPGRTSTSTFTVAVSDALGGEAGRTYVLEVSRPSSFGPPERIELPLAASDLVALELNRDGRADLAAGHRSPTTNVTLCVSESQNPLRATTIVQVRDVGQPGTGPAGGILSMCSGDFNGDGLAELIVRSSTGLGTSQPANLRPTLVPLLGTGSGPLAPVAALRVPAPLPNFASGDLDGDGRDDLLVTTTLNVPALGFYPTVYCLRSQGDGTFSEISRVQTTSPSQFLLDVVLGEFTGDQRRDLGAIVAGGVGVPRTLRIYRGQADGVPDLFSPSIAAVAQTTGSALGKLAAGDLDGDGRADLVATISNSDRVAVVFSSSPSTAVTMVAGPQGSDVGRPLVADLDGDGANDLVVPITGSAAADSAPGFLAVFLNVGNGEFDTPIRLRAGTSPHRVVAGDFDGDGRLDLAVSDRVAATIHVFPSVR
jgi:DNA-binding beta-propeller fold protein YncE/tetratricopeptide (TPR) repeat protein